MVKLYLPHVLLNPYVDHYLVVNQFFDQHVHTFIAARGIPMLMFPFAKPSKTNLKHHEAGSAYPRQTIDAPALLTANSTFCQCTFEGLVQFVMVFLKPTTPWHLVRESTKGLANRVLLLEEIGLQGHFSELQDRLWDVQESDAAIALIDNWLCKFFVARYSLPMGDFSPVLHHILTNPKVHRVNDVAKKFRCTERWLEKQCASQTSLSPKGWLRLIRFRRLVNYCLNKPNTSWMEIVARFHYTDQSHLIRDFKAFTNLTPTQYFARHAFMPELFLKQGEAGISHLMG